jgi:hypothetical protein
MSSVFSFFFGCVVGAVLVLLSVLIYLTNEEGINQQDGKE